MKFWHELKTRIFGPRCRNAPYGCNNRTRKKCPEWRRYCDWCWNRGLFNELRYRCWTEN